VRKIPLAGGIADSIAIAGEGTSKGLSSAYKASRKTTAKFSLEVKSSGTTPRYSIYLLTSQDGVNYVLPDDMSSALITVTDNNRHIKAFSPTLAPYYKLRIDGDSGNGSDTSLDELFVNILNN
jgi:hypothetical protein